MLLRFLKAKTLIYKQSHCSNSRLVDSSLSNRLFSRPNQSAGKRVQSGELRFKNSTRGTGERTQFAGRHNKGSIIFFVPLINSLEFGFYRSFLPSIHTLSLQFLYFFRFSSHSECANTLLLLCETSLKAM